MDQNESGTPRSNEMPNPSSEGLNQTPTSNNYSAKGETCKPLCKTFSGKWNEAEVRNHLQMYLDLGLVPIPLKDKVPLVKWKQWRPTTMNQLKTYIKPGINWGLKTGEDLVAIDFDSRESFYSFVVKNIANLPEGTPIVKTGRGYHIWFRPKGIVGNQHLEDIDVKGTGGLVVAPPSFHKKSSKWYNFINSPRGFIPELELDRLEFEDLMRKTRASAGKHESTIGSSTQLMDWRDKPRFNFELIKDGVEEGQRHTALVSYIGHLISRDLSKDEIEVLVTSWNGKNKSPLEAEEIRVTIEDCWNRYKKDVSTKTLIKEDRVLIETKNLSSISQSDADKMPNVLLTVFGPQQSSWETEPSLEEYNQVARAMCGRKRRITRQGRVYRSISFFCGRWDCPRCSSFFKARWIEHLKEKTKDLNLYVLKCDEEEWGRIRRSINRLGADYTRIRTREGLMIITNKSLKMSASLPNDELVGMLEKAIPDEAEVCPISTSRGWEREKNTKRESDYKLVTHSWLPVREQVDVAENCGAISRSHATWVSPIDEDEDEWEAKFIEGIREREREICWWLNNKEHGIDMEQYLNEQYCLDAVNDEIGKEDYVDRLLAESI